MTAPTDRNPPRPALENAERPVSERRRLLIKRAAITAPAIFTLYSGAALARSSIAITQAMEGEDVLMIEGEPACIDGDPIDTTTGNRVKLAPPYQTYPYTPQGEDATQTYGCNDGGYLISASSATSLTHHGMNNFTG
jgi:hypothetical protein